MFATTLSGFVWCCVRPLFNPADLGCSGLCNCETPPLEGVRGRLPPLARFFWRMIQAPRGNRWSGSLESLCAAARGTIIGTMRAVPIATGIIPIIATTISGFVWCCVRPRSSGPSSGCARSLRNDRAAHPCRGCSGNAGRCANSVFVRRGEGRRTAPGRSGPYASCKQGDNGASPATGI